VLYDVIYDGSRLVTAGDFTTFNGSARRGLAALTTTGVLDSAWPASAVTNNTARSISQNPSSLDLLAAGEFTTYGGVSGMQGTARFASASGAPIAGFTGASGLTVTKINKIKTP
jgi:hypothetical protein